MVYDIDDVDGATERLITSGDSLFSYSITIFDCVGSINAIEDCIICGESDVDCDPIGTPREFILTDSSGILLLVISWPSGAIVSSFFEGFIGEGDHLQYVVTFNNKIKFCNYVFQIRVNLH